MNDVSSIAHERPAENTNASTPTPTHPPSPLAGGEHSISHDTKPQQPPKKRKRWLVCSVVVGIFILLLSGSGAFAMYYASQTYVPFLSPVVEDIFVSDAEQMALRVEGIAQAGISQAIVSAQEAGLDVDTDYSDEELAQASEVIDVSAQNFEYEVDANISYSLDESVLSDESIDGLLGEEKFDLLASANEGVISIVSSGFVTDGSEFDGNLVGSWTASGITATADFDVVSTSKDVYFRLNTFPENPWIITDSIEDMWLHYGIPEEDLQASEVLSFYDLFGFGDTGTDTLSLEFKKSDMAEFGEILRTHAIVENTTRLPNEKIGEVSSKCYKIEMDQDALEAFNNEVNDITGGDTDFDDSTKSVTIEMCFGLESGFPHRVRYVTEFESAGTTITMDTNIQVFNLDHSFEPEIPQEAVEFEDVDWVEVFPVIQQLQGFEADLQTQSEELDLYFAASSVTLSVYTLDFEIGVTNIDEDTFTTAVMEFNDAVATYQSTVTSFEFSEDKAELEAAYDEYTAAVVDMSDIVNTLLEKVLAGEDYAQELEQFDELRTTLLDLDSRLLDISTSDPVNNEDEISL